MAQPKGQDLNVLVIGDIIVDHDILVKQSASVNALHSKVEGETAYEVERRYTTAGGAAGSARFLAMVNRGRTFLAGFSAPTLWSQALAEIMEKCRIYDNSPQPVELLCVWTAEGQGAVVSRLVELDEGGVPKGRLSRWDDAARFTLPDYKRQALPDWVLRTHNDSKLDGILLADLNRGTVDAEMVSSIAELAATNRIPLVVVPKWESKFYAETKGLALIPNLREWCHLVGEKEEDAGELEEYFRNGLERRVRLEEMALRSVRKFRGFRYHIVTADSDGIVLIGPIQEGEKIEVHRLPAIEVEQSIKKGAGDVFTAQFLFEYLRNLEIKDSDEAAAVQDACLRATAAAAAHLEADWQRMPTVDEVEAKEGKTGTVKSKAKADWPTLEIVWERLRNHISLDKMATVLPGIYTSDEEYEDTIEGIWDHICSQRGGGEPQGLLLGAPSGDGKSALLDAIELKASGAAYKGFEEVLPHPTLSEEIAGLGVDVVIIDEADKDDTAAHIKKHISVIEEFMKRGVVFVFAGTGFSESLGSELAYTEIYNRCKRFFPKPLAKRPRDVAVILAAKVFHFLEKAGIRRSELELERTTVDFAIEKMILASKTARWSGKQLNKYAEAIVNEFTQSTAGKQPLRREVPHLFHPDHQDDQSPPVRIVAKSE